jgi:hypothetical protein
MAAGVTGRLWKFDDLFSEVPPATCQIQIRRPPKGIAVTSLFFCWYNESVKPIHLRGVTLMHGLAKRIATSLILFLSYTSISSAETIVREVQLMTATDQIFLGGFGSGVFYRPTFELAPFVLNVGDTIDVTVRFDQPVVVNAGDIELESVGAFVTAQNIRLTSVNTVLDWNFLDVQGDLFTDDVFVTSAGGEGSGIGAHTGALPAFDLTDTRFAFQGVHYSITLTAGTGFPAVFTESAIAGQTQGGIHFGSIPEPCTLIVVVGGLITLSKYGLGQRRPCLIQGRSAKSESNPN